MAYQGNELVLEWIKKRSKEGRFDKRMMALLESKLTEDDFNEIQLVEDLIKLEEEEPDNEN